MAETLILPQPASDVKIKHTFIGGGASTRTDFKMLEPYIISTTFQNPEKFNYLYYGHGYESFDLSKTHSLSTQDLVKIFIHSLIHS
jgi:hypothetical protein